MTLAYHFPRPQLRHRHFVEEIAKRASRHPGAAEAKAGLLVLRYIDKWMATPTGGPTGDRAMSAAEAAISDIDTRIGSPK